MVAATKLRVKFRPEGSVERFKTSPDINTIEHSVGEEGQSKKHISNKLEEIQAKKKQKLDCILYSQCLTVLKLLMEHHNGWIFNIPVDPVKLMIPDYFSIISNPMDLGTVKSKLLKNEYSNVDEFAADVRLTFNNALMYNPTNNWAHKTAQELKEIFEVRWELLMKKKVSKISGVEVKERSKSSPEASASSGRFYVEEPKPVKEESEKVSRLSKPMKGQSKKEAPAVTRKAFATKSNKADLTRIQIEKEEMEITQREEKARIEAGMKAAKIAARMRAQAELKQKRERQRLELEKMKNDYDFDENNHWRLEKDFFNVCGSTGLRRVRQLLKELGLVLRNDYCPELEELDTKKFDAMRLDDLEEGEIF